MLAVGFVNARATMVVQPGGEVVVRQGEQIEKVASFRPELVPGATPALPHQTTWKLIDLGPAGAIQFYLGIDGLNVWLIVLTNILMISGRA